ncbi:MAG: aldehyde dehydrogenase family protein [Planctomycetota bacterium]|nr:aldehyde dehydrogenase family protein [Planctomycetota bacterium]
MSLNVINPFDGSLVCSLDYDSDSDVQSKVDAAHQAQISWRQIPIDQRISIVEEGLSQFRSLARETISEVSLQMGKPISEARNELETVFDRANYMISIARESLAAEILPDKEGFHRRIEHEPLGVVLNLAAWNYPLIIPVNVVVPALIAGNTVLLKHSARTPLSGVAYQQAFGKLQVPDLVTNLVLGHEQTARLISDNRIAHVAFTGSVAGGAAVHREVSKRFIDCGLELGGNDPAYIAEDADLSTTSANVVEGACYNAGQSCCAVERAYVHSSQLDEFVTGALEAMSSLQMGNPLDESTTLGPLVGSEVLDQLEEQVEDAVERGASLLCGGKRVPNEKGNFFPPTLLVGATNDSLVMQEESFGPILPILSVEDDDEALQQMNDNRFGLTASVWTRDRERAEHFAKNLNTGTVFQNRCDYLDPALPWTGVGDSGKGSTLSKHGFFHLTRRKAIHFRL